MLDPTQLLIAIIAYWALAFIAWILRMRAAGKRELSRAISAAHNQAGQREFTVEVAGEVNLWKLALIALAPPVAAIGLWIAWQ